MSGLSTWQTFWRIELPLAWPGLLAGMALTVAHTLGEFGVVLMVGGSIPGETRTVERMRNELARRNGAAATCPVTTAIYLKVVAEVALDDLQADADDEHRNRGKPPVFPKEMALGVERTCRNCLRR